MPFCLTVGVPALQNGGMIRPMANLKVVIVRLCKTEKGWQRFPVLYGKNGRIRPGVVKIAGKEVELDGGRYQLRYYVGRKMVYRDIGTSASDAIAARDKQAKVLGAKNAAREAGVRLEEDAARVSLSKELERFLRATRGRGSMEAAEVYGFAVNEFLGVVRKGYVDEISEEDLTRYQEALRKRGMSDRTIHNRHANVIAFLRWCKLPVKGIPRPKFEKTLPEVYTPEEMKAFFSSIKNEKRYITYEILLKCGLREQEAIYLNWGDVDLKRGVIRVRENPHYGFKVKDSEARDVPIEDELLARMKRYRMDHPNDSLVTSTKTGHPNMKMLRTLKRLVKRAKLNCGHCRPCDRGECELWFLHKFRATYITMLLRSGVDLRTIMKFSGHSDLASVMRYLSPAGDEVVRGRVNAIRWMV